MAEVAQLQRADRDRTESGRERPPVTPHTLYFAFLSYSHADSGWGEWLHDALEKFRVPSSLAGRLTGQGIVPKRLTPIFRDRKELAASSDLGAEIRDAITASRFLIVLCSPAAANSRWTNAEIDTFKRVRPDGAVLAAIVDGEPFASEIPGREAEECLPPALRIRYDRKGRPTQKRAEPLCTDLREDRDGKRIGLLKLVAGMLGVGLDDLVQRETVRRQRRLAILAAASLAGMAITSTLAITAIQARDEARDQRRQAEGLVGFMLGDLKDELEPIGRLDALDAVGSRALAYYQSQDKSDLSDEARDQRRMAESLVGFMLGDLRAKLEPLGRLDVLDSVGVRALEYYQSQDKSSLSDESLAQRSKALTLMGEIANTRGDLDRGLKLYREAYAGTAEALRRDPANPERMFDHAQNVFWIGYIDHQRGRLEQAEASMREYQRLAQAMVAADPNNPKWQLEQSYADSNLGVLLLERRKFAEAGTIFARELRNSEAMLAAEPNNARHQDRLVEALAWLADAHEYGGKLDEAIGHRERQLALIDHLSAARRDDAELKRKQMTAERAVGRLFAARGDRAQALPHLGRAVALADQLMRTEPNNTEWAQLAAASTFALGQLQLATGDAAQAGSNARAGCDLSTRLAERDSSVVRWRAELRGQCLELRVRVALARNAAMEASAIADEAVRLALAELARAPSADNRLALAAAQLLRGDVAERQGDRAGAARAWSAALAAWPTGVDEKPRELAMHAYLLRKSGQGRAASAIARRLAVIGYRHPEFPPA